MQRGLLGTGSLHLQQVQVYLFEVFGQKMFFLLSCCTNCTATCISCPLGTKLGADKMVKAILGLGGAEYKYAFFVECFPIPPKIKIC